ncbi:formate dehydrogenase accessory protein FdhD [Methylobacterium platani]|uniref:Sulfur carrier protein FdhD n=2 Tax=Methylobacterium platani TaxID=427683 RepID=A0A179S5V3_9HYPH|nr:formate dehydrogenase accessory protein FdhD [Methylobacterium platani]
MRKTSPSPASLTPSMPPSSGVATSQSVPTRVVAYGRGAEREGMRPLAVEMPVNVVYGDVPYAVMMTTPADLEDFAYGFSLTEGIVAGAEEIRGAAVEAGEGGLRLVVDLAPGRLREHLARKRVLSGRTGCGVCGIDDLKDIPKADRHAAEGVTVSLGAVERALQALDDLQVLGRETRAVHAAAWADRDGTILAVREDVGRHNALDKLIGALLRAGTRPEDGFLVITSRCSFEMVEKAASFGAAILVAISAPTSLAVERAARHGLTLAAIARHDTVTLFTAPERLTVP